MSLARYVKSSVRICSARYISVICDLRYVSCLEILTLRHITPPRKEGLVIEKAELLFDRGRLPSNTDTVIYLNKELIEEVSN